MQRALTSAIRTVDLAYFTFHTYYIRILYTHVHYFRFLYVVLEWMWLFMLLICRRCRSRRTVCSVCNVTINADELVMRINNGKQDSHRSGKRELGHFVYHLGCFRCCLCSVVLRTGDHSDMRDDASVYCQRRFPSPSDHGHHHDTTIATLLLALRRRTTQRERPAT